MKILLLPKNVANEKRGGYVKPPMLSFSTDAPPPPSQLHLDYGGWEWLAGAMVLVWGGGGDHLPPGIRGPLVVWVASERCS